VRRKRGVAATVNEGHAHSGCCCSHSPMISTLWAGRGDRAGGVQADMHRHAAGVCWWAMTTTTPPGASQVLAGNSTHASSSWPAKPPIHHATQLRPPAARSPIILPHAHAAAAPQHKHSSSGGVSTMGVKKQRNKAPRGCQTPHCRRALTSARREPVPWPG
jgi:hypothetical protein